MRISDVLRGKGTDVVTIPGSASVADLVALLRDNGIGAVVVVDEADSEKIAGIDELNEVAVKMTDRRIRHLPVVEEGRLTSIVSIGDVVKARLGELQAERDALEGYISS